MNSRISRITIGRLYNLGSYEHVRYELTVEVAEHESATTALEGMERLLVALSPREPGSVPTESTVKSDERRVADMRERLAKGFEDSHIPLRKWLVAWYLLCSSKKGISSLQIQRMLGLGSYRSALFMMHRIRYALKHPSFAEKMMGTIEVDETYIGGKHKPMAIKMKNKTAVVSLVQRGGNVRSQVMERVTGENLRKFVTDNVTVCSYVNTDDYFAYRGLAPRYEHGVVKHSVKEYVRGTIHTNTVEGYFSLLKRGVIGTFHQVSRKHLPLYLAEFDHRYNHRKTTDGERTVEGIKLVEGKRLTLKPLKRGLKK